MKNRLKECRKVRQWSQADLARALGVSRQAVNGFESGKFDPSLEMAFKLSHLLDVAIEDLFIYEAKNTMQTVLERVKKFLGLEFGFERFTEQAIQAINYARHEAARTQSEQVEPGHLLTGLLAEPTTSSAQLMRDSGATLEIAVPSAAFESSKEIRFSSQTKFVLEMALQVVRLRRQQHIDTEHLLWGLMSLLETNQTTLKEQFQSYAIDADILRQRLTQVI
ncbi:MAG: helix-turn-helix domain-containing protein [Leptolyngbyaceae cyanobacterium]